MQRAPSGGEGKANPHPPIFEKGRPTLVPLPHRSHGQRHLHQRIDEALVVDPLPPQHDHDGDHHQEERPDKGLPSRQRQQPSLPRHRVGGTHPLKEKLGVAELARHHPVGNVGVDEALPIVFGRGKVKGSGELADDLRGKNDGDGRGHHHHNIDQQQFTPAQTSRPAQFEQGIDQPRQQGQQANRADRTKTQGHEGALQVQGAIGHAAADESSQKGAQGKGPKRKGRAGFFCGRLRVGRL